MRYVRNRGLSGIQFVGEVPQSELPRYYQTCDVFCSPALSGESFGMVLLEAMAAGKPVVATNIDGYRQVVHDGVEGRLVEPRDSASLATALIDLLQSPEMRKSFGERGRVTARAFSWDRVAARLIRFYDEVRHESATTHTEWLTPLELPPPWLLGRAVTTAEPTALSENSRS
jgi:phosphatidylinositol alpha-mannosyltransferase